MILIISAKSSCVRFKGVGLAVVASTEGTDVGEIGTLVDGTAGRKVGTADPTFLGPDVGKIATDGDNRVGISDGSEGSTVGAPVLEEDGGASSGCSMDWGFELLLRLETVTPTETPTTKPTTIRTPTTNITNFVPDEIVAPEDAASVVVVVGCARASVATCSLSVVCESGSPVDWIS